MKDTELQRIILDLFYNRRSEGCRLWLANDAPLGVNSLDFFRVIEQLGPKGLNWLEWEGTTNGSGAITVHGVGQINAAGVKQIESGEERPMNPSIQLVDNSIRVSSSHDAIVQAGQNNSQLVTYDFNTRIEQITKAIDVANATEASKKEARNLLGEFLKHPLVTSIAGGVVSGLAARS